MSIVTDISPLLLDEAQVRFILYRVAINASSCSAHKLPSVARAYGCRVAPDRTAVTVFVASEHSTELLNDLRAGGGIAVVFTRPATHETLQLKGLQAQISHLEEGDRECMRAYAQQFHDELFELGYNDPFLGAFSAPVELEALAVTFTPVAAFEQTPGPSAGRPLGSAA